MATWWQLFQGKCRHWGIQPAHVGGAGTALLTLTLAIVRARRASAARRPMPLDILPLSALVKLLLERQVEELIYLAGGSIIVQTTAVGEAGAQLSKRFVTSLVPGSEAELFRLALNAKVSTIRYLVESRSASRQMLSAVVPLILIFVWYRVAKSLLAQNEKFTPTRGKKSRKTETITFSDVISKSKVELSEIVDYLNNPQMYKQAGAKLPRGVLLVGPSGTGKTLLARAVAGEAHCQFISASAAEFVEVYVGRGAARIRDLFQQARAAAPVVLFFDELDALGSRGRLDGRAASEEYIQTLNQMLTEMDGFDGHSDGIVVLAATNRQEAIDPALLRPGRFDRYVFVDLPASDERLEILELHASKAAMAQGVPREILKRLADATTGFSGAELANVVNEAVFMALRAGRPQVVSADLDLALSRAQCMRGQVEGRADMM
eukprot:CAMPEP_0178415940 /NCGR_PEP_ID=MMETSP0689_2-20121128/23808_1 /TAXON_ID=160604 /ORGANISM="Amphidinium massartii, Strain CS-259" /LENGTH=434 /DNA_ID=CAMNT_0020037271 /DNA_START=6 /DNA_END=1307 /DNA_ORIENTATION=+